MENEIKKNKLKSNTYNIEKKQYINYNYYKIYKSCIKKKV